MPLSAFVPAQVPPTPAALVQQRPTTRGYQPLVLLSQSSQEAAQLPPIDIAVEVIGNLPLQLKLQDISRLLGLRQMSSRGMRAHKPTILELITLVNRNPEKPRGRAWNSIMALNMKYDESTEQVTVVYCVDRCGFDHRSGALDPGRRLAVYSAHEQAVLEKADKKLAELAKYAR